MKLHPRGTGFFCAEVTRTAARILAANSMLFGASSVLSRGKCDLNQKMRVCGNYRLFFIIKAIGEIQTELGIMFFEILNIYNYS